MRHGQRGRLEEGGLRGARVRRRAGHREVVAGQGAVVAAQGTGMRVVAARRTMPHGLMAGHARRSVVRTPAVRVAVLMLLLLLPEGADPGRDLPKDLLQPNLVTW